MKLSIALHDSGIKKNTSKEALRSATFSILEKTFESFLSANPHFKGVKLVTISMTLCGKAKIRNLNRTYRGKDYATDVLSFPLFEMLRADKKSGEKLFPEIELGDLVICRDVARKQAVEFGITYEQEIIHLAVHGFLHLIGYDHEISAKEEKIMEEIESELVKKIYKRLKVK